ncbi:MAG: GNAT family N-acetyltransferase [Polyangiaceae bacterium]|nr:GNAT family N-acetyltransferase [Polyangiaceae bacterium]
MRRPPVARPPALAVPLRLELRRAPLVTPRLSLAPLEPDDAHAMWLAVDACRPHLEPWLPWVPSITSASAAQQYIESSIVDWDGARALRFSVKDRERRRFLGVVSLEALSHQNLSADLGYWLHSGAWRSGLMTEAAGGVVVWAFRQLGAARVRVAASTENHPSLAVIRRLGFHFEGVARQAEYVHGRWLDHAVFSRLRDD